MIKPNPSESEKIEYKSNWNDGCLKVVSAFANTSGGELIIGVDDNKNVLNINARKLLVDLPNKIKDKLGIIPAVKLIIMNEVKLPLEVPVDKLKTNHLSKPRNRLIAEIFYYAGLIESWGRGTIKIVENCLHQGLPEPDFVEEYGVMNVIFYKDKWNEENLKKLGLNERQIKAVMYVKEKGKITNREYRQITGLSDEGARKDLKDIVQKNILNIKGKGRSINYILANAWQKVGDSGD